MKLTGEPCDNVVLIQASWPGGLTVALTIPITTSITHWKIDLTFSLPTLRLNVLFFPLRLPQTDIIDLV